MQSPARSAQKTLRQTPKRPSGGALAIWRQEKWQDIKAKLPGGSPVADITKKASALWSEMTPKQKERYETIFQGRREAYRQAVAKKTPSSDGRPAIMGGVVSDSEGEDSDWQQ